MFTNLGGKYLTNFFFFLVGKVVPWLDSSADNTWKKCKSLHIPVAV